MKNTTFNSALKLLKHLSAILIITAIFNSCKDDPCKDTYCLNGGACLDGNCNCPGGYSGTHCEIHDPCYNITCYNGGTCVNGSCQCPTGYTGLNCQTELTLVSVTITEVVVNQYPFDNNGFYWDTGTSSSKYPDLFLSENLGTTANDIPWTPYQSNVTASTVTFNSFYGSSTFVYPYSTYSISLWDWDGGNDNFMAGIYFIPADFKSGYPSTIHLSSSKLDMTLYVTWNF